VIQTNGSDAVGVGRSGKPVVLDVLNLTARYGTVVAVREASLTVSQGEIVAILGTNGAGKTTCLASIMGLHEQKQGKITFRGAIISGRSTEDIVRRGVALCLEGRKIFAGLTVEENLILGGSARTLQRKHALERAERYYDLFPVLEARRHMAAGNLSGGEQQQLAIARALMSDPSLLLLDEPSLGLAPRLVRHVFELIVRLRDEQNVTILLVEQNVRQALDICDRAYVLRAGTVAMHGVAAALRENTDVNRALLGLV